MLLVNVSNLPEILLVSASHLKEISQYVVLYE